MSQCIVPSWNLRQQRQEQVVEGEERNRSPHVQSEQNLSYVVPMSEYEVTELTWENGQLALHGLGGILPPPAPLQTKQAWGKAGDTLESIVHQATFNNFPQHEDQGEVKCSSSMPTSSGGKWGGNSSNHMHRDQQINHQEGNLRSMAASPGGKWRENYSTHMHMEQNDQEGNLSSIAASSGGKWRENSSQMHMEYYQEGSLSSMAASSGVKWRENSSHLQVEQNGGLKISSMPIPSGREWRENSDHMQVEPNGGVKVSSTPMSSGGKWRENSAHMQVEQNGGVKVNSMPSSSGGKWRENLGHLQMNEQREGVKLSSIAASSGGKWGENSDPAGSVKKRVRPESEQNCGRKNFQAQDRASERSACGSESATFCRDRDTTMMTWASFESPGSLKSARNTDDDSACHDCSENQDGEHATLGESFRSQSSARRSRVAATHNQSERRRRDRINEKMKALQKLVPNASKTDKASMLDEVIEYLKQLQTQVHMMNSARNMPQMMMPLGMQQQLQMSLLARMGMGMGMLDVNNLARNVLPPFIHAAAPLGGAASSFVSSPFAMPQVVPPPAPLKANVDAATINTSLPSFNDTYNTFLAQQSMNMDFVNKMAALYRQQANQPSRKPVSLSKPNHGQRE